MLPGPAPQGESTNDTCRAWVRLGGMLAPAIELFTLLIIGFSIFAAAILLIAYLFFLPNMQKTAAGKLACAVLLTSLSGLQIYHFAYMTAGMSEPFDHRLYVMLLMVTPPSFYFFSRELLLPDPDWSPWQLLHAVPLLLSAFIPISILLPVAFTIGAGYSIWLARIVYGMRRNVGRFRFEMFFFSLFAILAVLVLVLFALVPYLDESAFYIAYANFTGIALLLIVAALIVFPALLEDITEVARITYAKSTLTDVDVDAKLRELERAMAVDRLYEDENLNLKTAADAIGLSGHQLSELINTHFGLGFSRYVRDRRVAAAKQLLREDREASILSISMATGFRSQSNFYAAFKEIAGMSPGQYRETPE